MNYLYNNKIVFHRRREFSRLFKRVLACKENLRLRNYFGDDFDDIDHNEKYSVTNVKSEKKIFLLGIRKT
jgi:hypothetical protein